MKTDGGTHSVEDWAMVTASQIMPLDSSLSGGRLLAAQELQLAVAKALIPRHQKHREFEHRGLAAGDDHYDTPIAVPDDSLAKTVAVIVDAARGTPWESHFLKPDVQEAVAHEVKVMFATHSDVERQHHVTSGKTDGPKARAFHASRHPA